MTKNEYLKSIASVAEVMESNGIKPHFIEYTQMYDDWVRLRAEGHKVAWIVAFLCDQYSLARSTFYNITRLLGEDFVI